MTTEISLKLLNNKGKQQKKKLDLDGCFLIENKQKIGYISGLCACWCPSHELFLHFSLYYSSKSCASYDTLLSIIQLTMFLRIFFVWLVFFLFISVYWLLSVHQLNSNKVDYIRFWLTGNTMHASIMFTVNIIRKKNWPDTEDNDLKLVLSDIKVLYYYYPYRKKDVFVQFYLYVLQWLYLNVTFII